MNSSILARSLDQPVSLNRSRAATRRDPIPALERIFSPLSEPDQTLPQPDRPGVDEWVSGQICLAHLLAVALRA